MSGKFSDRLRSSMEAAGIGGSALARAIDQKPSAVSRWLKGAVPDIANASKLANALNVSVQYLLTGEGRLDEEAKMLRREMTAAFGEPGPKKNFAALSPRDRLRAARLAKGLSVMELAKQVGYSISVYQDIEDGRSQMGEKQAKKVAAVLDLDVSELLDGSDEPPARGGLFPTFGTLPNIVMGPGMEGSKTKNVPLISMAQCGAMGAYSDEVYTRGGFPAIDCDDPRAFAVTLAGDSMEPTHKAGDVAVVCPSDSLRNEDLVLVKIKEGQGPHSGDVMFKLYQATRDQVTLSSYNPSFPPMTWPRDAFEWIYRVQGVTRLYPKRKN